MYNFSLPNLCATLVGPFSLTVFWSSAQAGKLLANAPTLYCAMPYITACVDVSERYFTGPFNN